MIYFYLFLYSFSLFLVTVFVCLCCLSLVFPYYRPCFFLSLPLFLSFVCLKVVVTSFDSLSYSYCSVYVLLSLYSTVSICITVYVSVCLFLVSKCLFSSVWPCVLLPVSFYVSDTVCQSGVPYPSLCLCYCILVRVTPYVSLCLCYCLCDTNIAFVYVLVTLIA